MEDTKKNNKAPADREPWDYIFSSQSSLISDLECIEEMQAIVLPALKEKDKERTTRLDDLVVEEKSEEDTGIQLTFKDGNAVKEALGHMRRLRKGDRMFRQSVITTIVSKFDEFLIDILTLCYEKHSNWIKNPDKKISYKELLEIESIDTLKEEIIAKEIDSLMRDSHYEQVKFLDTKLKLGIENEFPDWLKFLEITERRNLFVHTGGIVSPFYIENCKKWGITINEKVKEGVRLTAQDDYIKEAIDCIYELSIRITQAVSRRLYPECLDKADSSLNNPSVDLLSEERWDLAEKIFKFALSMPKAATSEGEMKYYFTLNLCIALKFGGKDYKSVLNQIDWTPFHPMYHFAVAVLEDRFADAKALMMSESVREKVSEENFREWPLLRDFRKSDEFKDAYKNAYNKDFETDIIEEAKKELEAQPDDSDNA